MGYVHDVSLAVLIPIVRAYKKSSAGWSLVRQANGLWEYLKGYAAETLTIKVPVELPSSSGAGAGGTKRGALINSIDFWYEIGTADLVSGPTGKVERLTWPRNGEAMPALSQETVTLEGADLGLIGARMARVSLDTPFWLGTGELCQAVLEAETAVGAEFYYYGARINLTLRE